MLNNKKILVIATTDNMIWQFLLPHIKHLQSRGNTVECVCAKTGFWFDDIKAQTGVNVFNIDFKRNPISLKNLKGYSQLKKLQKERQYDVVYCQQPVGAVMGRLIGKKFKIPVIYTAHGFHFFKGCPIVNKLVYKTVEKWLSKYTNTLITINQEDYDNAKKMKAKQVYKISGIGVDKNKFESDCFDKKEFKKSLGLGNSDKVVLTIAEFIPRKNYSTMLKTIKNLTEKDKTIKFVSCGKGELESDIKNQAEQLGIKENCLFLGFRKDVSKIIQVSDVFFLPSYQEGLTRSVMESMAFGLPCVVSNVRGNRDLIKDNINGFACDPTDDTSFSQKIDLLLTDKKLYSQISKQNKLEVKQYMIDSVIKQLDVIYNNFNF